MKGNFLAGRVGMNLNSQRVFSSIVFLLLLIFIGGCQTTGDVFQAKDEGTTKVCPVTKDEAWKIAMMVFRWEGADAIEEHKDEGYMLTSSGMNLVSYGSVMGAWVEPVGAGESRVTVVTKRRIATNFVTTLTESTFHTRFAQGVDIVKSGNPLPHTPPN